jgi:hypothetical protein
LRQKEVTLFSSVKNDHDIARQKERIEKKKK